MKQLFKDLGIPIDFFTPYKLILALITFLLPIAPLMFGICILIMIDFTVAIIAAYKLKEPISSRKMKATIPKLFAYLLLIIGCKIVDQLTGAEVFIKICTFFLCSVEIFSIGEGFNKITGLNFVSYLKKYLASKMPSMDDKQKDGH